MLQHNVPLKDFSHYRIGGPARFFLEAHSEEEFIQGMQEWKKIRGKNKKIFVLGSGTNLLISDNGFPGLVVRWSGGSITQSKNLVKVDAGVLVSDLLNFCIKEGISGLEWAGGLPGTMGGAIRGNAGAFGGEIQDNIVSVNSLDIGKATFPLQTRTKEECEFGYRTSIFKERARNEMIVSTVLLCEPGEPQAISKVVEEKIAYRKERHPIEFPNAGSIFKNIALTQINADITQINAERVRVHLRDNPLIPVFEAPVKQDPFPVIPTAYLLAEAGMKGVHEGGAQFSPKHPNFIVNTGGAKALDVKKLIYHAKASVKKKFGIELEEEVMYIS